MEKITEQGKRGWRVELNGQVVPMVEQLKLTNSRFGVLEYGLTDSGYDSWQFHEVGDGGSVIIPYAKIGNQIFIGMVQQNRPNQGGIVWNIPRGFLAFDTNHFATAQQELEEEVGIISREIQLLGGRGMNPNSTFFVTEKGEGARVYCLEIKQEDLIDKGVDGWMFNPKVLRPLSKSAEQIFGCRFFPWQQATEVGDMFTLAAIARLLAVTI